MDDSSTSSDSFISTWLYALTFWIFLGTTS